MPLLLHDEMVLLHDVRGLLVPAIRQHGMQPEIDTNPTPLCIFGTKLRAIHRPTLQWLGER